MRRLVWPLAAAFVLTSLPFSAWATPPASALSVYRLPTGAYQLLVRPGQAALERTGGVGGDRRVLVLTVPVVPGVSLESAVFPSFESLAGHVMAAYAEASRLDTSTPHACSGAAPSGASAGSEVSDVIDQPPSAPRLFQVLPTAGPAFMPIAIGGTNFGVGTIPYVNGTPSVRLFNWNCQNIPLIGSISVGFTIVPPAAPSGAGDVVVEYFGQRSNPFPFTKN